MPKAKPQPLNVDAFRAWLDYIGSILKETDALALFEARGDLAKEWEFATTVFTLDFLIKYFGFPEGAEFPFKVEIYINGAKVHFDSGELMTLTEEMLSLPEYEGFTLFEEIKLNPKRWPDYEGQTLQIIKFEPPKVRCKLGGHTKLFLHTDLIKTNG